MELLPDDMVRVVDDDAFRRLPETIEAYRAALALAGAMRPALCNTPCGRSIWLPRRTTSAALRQRA